MRRSSPLIAAVALLFVLSALASGCGGSSPQNKPGLVTSWGKDGVVELPGFEVKQTIEDRSGRIVAVGNYEGNFAEVVRLLPNGSLDPSFGKDGVVRWPFHMFQGRFPHGMDYLGWDEAALLPDGRIALAGTNIVGLVDDESTLVVSEIDQSGKVVGSFGQNGYFTADKRLYDCSKIGKGCERQFYALARKKTTCTRGPTGLAVQGEKIVVSANRFCELSDPHHIVVMRLNANGTLDMSFGNKGEVIVSGAASLADEYIDPLLALPNGHLVVSGTTPKGGNVQLTGLLENGAFDSHFGRKGVALTRVATDSRGIHALDALLEDKHGILSLTGSTDDGPFLVRFDTSGDPVNFWAGSPWTPWINAESNSENFGGAFGLASAAIVAPPNFAQLPSGELVGAGALLARIKPNGAIDPSYPPQQMYGAGKLRNKGLLVTSDGTVLVTLLEYHTVPGTFTTYLARYR